MREHGGILSDGIQVASTIMCCHCGAHFVSQRGSGIKRGYCLNCSAITCGKEPCMTCIPFEAQLEIMEGNQRTIRKYGPIC